MDSKLTPTLAFEIENESHEREVRSFLEALDVHYYILSDKNITSYSVIVVSSSDMIEVGRALVPKGN